MPQDEIAQSQCAHCPMLVHFIGCHLILLILQSVGVTAPVPCEPNWFGADCDLMCNCEPENTCNEKGECVGGGHCKAHHFGPSCQYENIITRLFNPYMPSYLNDNDDSTCNPDSHTAYVKVDTREMYVFSWYRIKVNNPTLLLKFTTQILGKRKCWNEQKYVLDTTTVDVSCDTTSLQRGFLIVGGVAPSVCTVYVSQGRNVASRQKTWQSSNFNANEKECGSGNAVDRKYETEYEYGECSQTGIETDGPEWRLTLKRPTWIHCVKILNRADFQHRLNGFSLSLYNEKRELERYMVPYNASLGNYKIPITLTTAISYLVIKQSTTVPLYERLMTICEIHVHGDPECHDGTYGIFCDRKCACNMDQACNFATGACAPGCTTGKYGFNCSMKCSEHCGTGTCNSLTGQCEPCTDGFLGRRCDLDCKEGEFADIVICRKCSPGCIGACNKTNGHCQCKEGYEGNQCQDCRSGSYGPELLCPSCPVGCANTCDKINGHCTCKDGFFGYRCTDCPTNVIRLDCNFNCSEGCDHRCKIVDELCSCDSGFLGPLCSECEATFYGERCDKKCLDRCLDQICFRSNGTCLECAKFYTGVNCDIVNLNCEEGTFPEGLTCIQCSPGCINVCNKTNGHCQCKEGYEGKQCRDCPSGQYGPELFCPSCSEGCADICNKTDGHCNCRDGFVGYRCTDCPVDVYRLDCNFNCSEGCDHRCTIVDELCSCNRSFLGELCSECEATFYGERCDLKCSDKCLDQICFRSNGTCLQCVEGYTGTNCDKFDEKLPEWLLMLLIASTLMFTLCCLCACRIFAKRRPPKQIGEMQEEM